MKWEKLWAFNFITVGCIAIGGFFILVNMVKKNYTGWIGLYEKFDVSKLNIEESKIMHLAQSKQHLQCCCGWHQ